jgi:hypothetical protein
LTGQTIYIEFDHGHGHRVDRVNTNPSYDLAHEYALAAADPQWLSDQAAMQQLAEAQYDIQDD